MPTKKPLNIRLPEAIRSELQAHADRAERSVNKEVVFRLRESLRQERSEEAPGAA
jgi:hypothetical protein